MLVLSRKQGESIRIADQITVTIVELSRGRVRVGFQPRSTCRCIAKRSSCEPPTISRNLPANAATAASELAPVAH